MANKITRRPNGSVVRDLSGAFERSARWALVECVGPLFQGRWPWLFERLAPWAEIAFEHCDDIAFEYWELA